MSNNFKQEWEANLIHTLKALNLIDENKENTNYQLGEDGIPQSEEQDNTMMNMKNKMDSMINQLLKQITL